MKSRNERRARVKVAMIIILDGHCVKVANEEAFK